VSIVPVPVRPDVEPVVQQAHPFGIALPAMRRHARRSVPGAISDDGLS
jgi:hypothetical protein